MSSGLEQRQRLVESRGKSLEVIVWVADAMVEGTGVSMKLDHQQELGRQTYLEQLCFFANFALLACSSSMLPVQSRPDVACTSLLAVTRGSSSMPALGKQSQCSARGQTAHFGKRRTSGKFGMSEELLISAILHSNTRGLTGTFTGPRCAA
jgi:hypothetical protein